MSHNRRSLRRHRRRINPLAGLTAAAALLTGLLVAAHTAQQQAEARTAGVPAAPSAAPSTPGAIVITDALPSSTPGSVAAEGAGAAAATAPLALRYSFDDGAARPLYSTSGHYRLKIVTAAGGRIEFAARGSGYALRFPRRCTTAPTACPRAILQSDRADALNPGTRPMRYGATVRMTSADTGDGANVLQKGFSVGGATQFKLQVDGRAGRPSCVIASATRIYRIVATTSVADGRWHALACIRSGTRLGITVDGVPRGSGYVPAGLSIANAEPLRIGGKSVNPGNDQFAGLIDDVFLAIG